MAIFMGRMERSYQSPFKSEGRKLKKTRITSSSQKIICINAKGRGFHHCSPLERIRLNNKKNIKCLNKALQKEHGIEVTKIATCLTHHRHGIDLAAKFRDNQPLSQGEYKRVKAIAKEVKGIFSKLKGLFAKLKTERVEGFQWESTTKEVRQVKYLSDLTGRHIQNLIDHVNVESKLKSCKSFCKL